MLDPSYGSGHAGHPAPGDETPQTRSGHRWYDWAAQHPGVVLLGAVAVALLAVPTPPRTCDVERNPEGEEVPLFI